MVRRWRRATTAAASCAEVLVDGDKWAVVAERVLPHDIMGAEKVPEWL